MRPAPFLKLATTMLSASAVRATACSEQDPTAPGRMSPKNLRPSSVVITTTTDWDFVQLAGGDGNLGNPKTFTIAGAGSVVASATATPEGANVYRRVSGSPRGPRNERARPCRNLGFSGSCEGKDFGDR